MVRAGTISAADASLAFVTDDVDEAMRYVERHAIDAFGLRRHSLTPSSLLGENRPIQPDVSR